MKSVRDKLIRYLLAVLLISLGILISGELTIKTLFYENPYDNVSVYDYTGDAEYFLQLEADAKEMGVSIVLTTWQNSGSYMKFIVYGSEDALSEYQEMSGIEEGSYISLLSDSIYVYEYPISEFVADEDGSFVNIYFVSKDEAKRILPAQWILDHGFDDITGSNTNLRMQAAKNVGGVWLIIVVSLSLFSYYDCISQKKRFFVMVSLGDSIGRIVIRNIVCDACIYGVIFFAGKSFAARYVYLPTNVIPLWLVFIVLNIGNILVHFSLFGYSFKEAFSKNISAKELGVSYTMRLITLITLIVLCNANVSMIKEYIGVTEHESFYRYYSDYCQLTSNYGASDYTYLTMTDVGRTSLFMNDNDIENGGTHPVVYLNKGSADWLMSEYPSLKLSMEADVCVLYPSTIGDLEKLKTQVGVSSFETGETYNYEYVQYNISIEDPGNSGFSTLTMEWAENPVLVIDYRENMAGYSTGVYSESGMPDKFRNCFIVDASGYDVEDGVLTLDEGISFNANLLWQQYVNDIAPYKVGFIWETVLLCVMAALEICVLLRSVRLEFEVNASKYVIKRILGDTIPQTYADLFLFTALQCLSGALLSKLILTNGAMWKFCFGIGAAAFVCETVLILISVVYMEHVNFQKILKGGAL